eukprot:XP_011662500.1 PREDICTED: sushi, von Willebrand factor type A, EGF and pentraxin domain-containing protein 1-like [Strongylocentrotus purpuratus]
MSESDRSGRYTVRGGGGNIWLEGVPSGSRVQVSVSCNVGAIAQQSVTSQCSNGTWIPPWPRCEKPPCSVPINIGEVRQFVNGDATRPTTSYYTPSTLPDGTQLVARCRDPGKHRLVGDQRRTCQGGQWTGEEPQCRQKRPCSVPINIGEVRQFVNGDATRPITSYYTPSTLPHGTKLVARCRDPGKYRLIEKRPCSVPINIGEVRQFVNGDATRPITSYYTPSTLPHGTKLVARCRDPGKYRLIGDQRRTCEEGQWTGEEPECREYQS